MSVRRVLLRAAVAALASSVALLVPAAAPGSRADAPGHVAQSPPASSVLAAAHRPVRVDETMIDVATASPTPSATAIASATAAPPATVAPAPPPTRVVAPPTRVVAPPPNDGGWYDAAFASRLLYLINVERARIGLAPLAVEPRLTASATTYARVLSGMGALSHVGPDGSTLVTRTTAAGFPFNVPLGEVLAWGNEGWTAEGVVSAWLNSPPHRQDILSPTFRRAGIGCYFTPANGVTVYCAMDLAG